MTESKKPQAKGINSNKDAQKKISKKVSHAYKRQNRNRFKKLRDKWQVPRGIDSDMRQGRKADGLWPSKTHRTPKAIRGLHPSGLSEVLVANLNDLKGLKPEESAVRIKSTVGKRKRKEIIALAQKQKLRVLNA